MDGAAARVAESEAGAERIKTARGEAKGVILDAAQEAAVLRWVSYGKTNEEIAKLEQMKLCTVKKCLERIFKKLGVENRTSAASFCPASPATERGEE